MINLKKIGSNAIILTFVIISQLFIACAVYANNDVISLFPIEHYDQTLSDWIKPDSADFDKPLLSENMQQERLEQFYSHYFGSASPWSQEHVNMLLLQSSPNDLKSTEESILKALSNADKSGDQIGYDENFRPHTNEWISKIEKNMNLSQFAGLTFKASNRGIVIDNLPVRALPNSDVHFYDHKLAGQGYPFDNLQMSALWVGTPVYIVGETDDHAWMLVITPDYIAWIKSNGIARVDDKFVNEWSGAAKNKLAAITHTQTSIVDEKGNFLYTTYVGAVFPAADAGSGVRLMVPVLDTDHRAVIEHAIVSSEDATFMPLAATPHNFSNIMRTLIGRPYGWGGIYFYNDCSAELKSLFTPFGIWLPRHSSDQVNEGRMVDLSADSPDKRLAYLMENGKPFLTIIYIGGHIVLYIGNHKNMAMTYQDLWGLSPTPPNRRAVIGESVLFPLLLQYPEDTTLLSQAAKPYFQVSFLNELPPERSGSETGHKNVNLKSLSYPDNN